MCGIACIGVVSTLGYIFSLTVPTVIGLIGKSVGLLSSRLVVLVAISIAGLLSKQRVQSGYIESIN